MSVVTTRPDSWQAALDLVKERGYERQEEPFTLASGRQSHDYIDGKYAVNHGDNLALVARAVADLAEANGIEFDAVGGLTMGAGGLAIAISIVAHKHWFAVRKERKDRGRNQWIEGTRFEGGKIRVLLVDDVVSGVITGAIPIVDRGDAAAKLFVDRGVPYLPLMNYNDLGIDPV